MRHAGARYTVITDLNPGHLPGPSPQLTSGVFLRNANANPVIPDFNVTSTGTGGSTRNITLDGTQAYDPNGQTLVFQWYATNIDSRSADERIDIRGDRADLFRHIGERDHLHRGVDMDVRARGD